MKIAVATNDGIRVTGHIGRCRSFKVYEINDKKIVNEELRENIFTNHQRNQEHNHEHEHHHGEGHGHGHDHHHGEGHEHGHNHNHLIEGLRDCAYLISKGGGWRVVEDLKQNNITPLFADVELIEDAVDMFIKGELENNSGLVCNHNNH